MTEFKELSVSDLCIFRGDCVLLRNDTWVPSYLIIIVLINLKNFLISPMITGNRNSKLGVSFELFSQAKMYFLDMCFGKKHFFMPRKIKKAWHQFRLADKKGIIPEDIKKIVRAGVESYKNGTVVMIDPKYRINEADFPVLFQILKNEVNN